nr:hypothetical protein [Saprospiraceae bacterium]
MDSKDHHTQVVSVYWNPFRRLKGMRALAIGLVFLVIGSVGSVFGEVRYPGIFTWQYVESVHWLSGFFDQILGILIAVVVFYLIAYIFGARKIHILNMTGGFLVARGPIVFLPFLNFNGWLYGVSENLIEVGMEGEELPGFGESVVMVLVSILLLLCFVWTISLLFSAYRESTRLRGIPSLISFILGIIVSLILTGWMIPDYYFG